MSAYNISDNTMRTSAGQSVGQVWMCLDGVYVPVVTLKVAAIRLGYSLSCARMLCDMGTLIGFKIDRCWWVLERSIEIQASTLGLPSQKAS